MTEEIKTEAARRDPGKGTAGPGIFFAAAAIIAIILLCIGIYIATGSESPVPTPHGGEIPVPGNPELSRRPIGEFYGNGTQIYITENRNATDPGYWQLLSFLSDDPTAYGVYGPGHECSSFAVELHDNAEACHIKAHIVLVTLSNAPLHMIVGFNTTDRGIVYVDDTGLTQDEIDRNVLVAPRIANVTVGSTYMWHYIDPYDFDADPGMGVVENVSIIS